jgi:prevent-host-death family protein
MSKIIDIDEAKTQFSELLSLAIEGTEVILVNKDNQPLVRLVPVVKSRLPRVAGLHKGEGWISEDFNDPLPDEFWIGEQ